MNAVERDGPMVLDGLIWIKNHIDPRKAFAQGSASDEAIQPPSMRNLDIARAN